MPGKVSNQLSATATALWQKAGGGLKSAYHTVRGAFSRWKVRLFHPESTHLQRNTTAHSGRSKPVTTEIQQRTAVASSAVNKAAEKAVEPDLRSLSREFEGAGGHADIFIPLQDKLLLKRTTIDESRIYRKRQSLGFDEVIPATTPAAHKELPETLVNAIDGVARSAAKGESVVILENLGAGIGPQHKRELDIKIGHFTASRSQLERSGHKSPRRKKARMKLFDIVTGSSKRGFRLVGGKIHGKKIRGSRAKLGMNTVPVLARALSLPEPAARKNLEKIFQDLLLIRSAMQVAPVTFVDSSVLVVIDEQNPDNTQVKMIDFSNPVYRENAASFDKARLSYLSGLNYLIAEVRHMLHVSRP